ncbi:UDP-glucuronosyltransferase 2C1 [Drosophila mauritiana]|uniref:UDP-glucuronosyltransferase 2C1 n=1 Tax=Drosophila mauritiana TaxID=7226 RepID=A0A6P8K8X3_DROMA|nr:UDP-glucuronosyltransferase 2C1 [Drosophila mauritiana]
MVLPADKILLLAIAIGAFMGSSQGANILGLFTNISPSHLIIQMSAAKVLAENGHNVTVVTVLKPVVNHKNISVIQVPLSREEAQLMSDKIGVMSKNDNSNMALSLLRMSEQMDFMIRKNAETLMNDRVRDLYLNRGNKFDLVISGYFINDFQLGFARKVNAPVIVLATMPPNQLLNPLIGNPLEVSYAGITNPLEGSNAVTFQLRLANYMQSVVFGVVSHLAERRNRNWYKKVYGNDPNMPEYSEMLKNTSLVFFSSHAASEGPIRPNVPSAIEIGGIQIKDKPDPLPQNIAEFLGNATNGAILLSLGSNVQGKHLNPETVVKMFNVLSKLKERVIWKWEDKENTPGKSANILYSKWLPQDDILAHPTIKLFINHAGKGGITESQYHGKPMLSLPVFGDQPRNANAMVKSGFGLTLSLLTLEEQPFEEAILEILSNPQYAERVMSFSTLYRDRPMTARQSFLYWTEYVIRHHGAAHLQSPVLHMNFIAANNIDIYFLIFVILISVLILIKFLVQFIYRRFISKPKKVKTN